MGREMTVEELAQKALVDSGFDTPTFQDQVFLRRVGKYALWPKPEPILILGETGTGKELVANAIHKLSGRKGKPKHVLCPGIPSGLIESSLFGYKRGAFSGALKTTPGYFDEKDGTIFLDEIGDFPLELQPKLLKVLNDGTYIPVGDTKERTTSCRVISATNRDIAHDDKYRKDLYHRIGVLVIRIPALRDEIRKASIHSNMLNVFFSGYLWERIGPGSLTPEAIDKLSSYHWPGNYRELKSVLTRAYVENQGNAKLKQGHSHVRQEYSEEDLKKAADEVEPGCPPFDPLPIKEEVLDGTFTVIDADMIQFDEDPQAATDDVSEKISGMNLLEAEAYAHRLHAHILEEKMNSIKNLKGHLRDLGRSDYATIRKRIRGQIDAHQKKGQEIIS